MDTLDNAENRSVFIIREAFHKFRKIGMLWSMGKDSTALLHLCRKAFMGSIPFPVVHVDTGYKFPEIYKFRDRIAKEYGLNLIIARNEQALREGIGSGRGKKLDCCTTLKTDALKQVIAQQGFDAVLVGIRRDEHGIRSKERSFSPRDTDFKWDYANQPAEIWDQFGIAEREDLHCRVHPLLHMTEADIWRYTRRENIPAISLYFARNGKRYRSIGCHPCCGPVDSTASTIDEIVAEVETSLVPERAGRAQDKEDADAMQKLRTLGYM